MQVPQSFSEKRDISAKESKERSKSKKTKTQSKLKEIIEVKEEKKEMYAVEAENPSESNLANYNQQFFVRGGYFYENQNQGNRQYFSLGAGFRMSVFQLDAAYLISTVQSNPLDQTLRFSLSFDMDGIKNLFR